MLEGEGEGGREAALMAQKGQGIFRRVGGFGVGIAKGKVEGVGIGLDCARVRKWMEEMNGGEIGVGKCNVRKQSVYDASEHVS